MDLKKLAPWNWFKNEEGGAGAVVPVRKADSSFRSHGNGVFHPMMQLHREMDRLFDNAFRHFGIFPLETENMFFPPASSGLLKPLVNVGANGQEYSITVEIPGVDVKDVRVEITGDTMTISGEKRQEKEEEEKNYYRIERSYGSFQRTLTLPEDADQEKARAAFKNGILTVAIPRKPVPGQDVRQIEIKDEKREEMT